MSTKKINKAISETIADISDQTQLTQKEYKLIKLGFMNLVIKLNKLNIPAEMPKDEMFFKKSMKGF